MNAHKKKIFRLTPFLFFVILLFIMFIITVSLTYKLLTNDHCNCPHPETVIKYVARPKHYTNRGYESNHKLAILVPYRDRFEELMEFAPYIHDFLNDQKIYHDIFILNQVDSYRFNRASLINAGFLQVKNDYDYVAMHDVDLLPLNKNLSYAYPEEPMHLAAPHLHPRYHYQKFIGGILLIKREHFAMVNGLSNKYWGWGLEDDEFYVRLKDASLNVTRPENISTGMNNTFRHIHGKSRKRDTVKCYNQREVTRKRDRQTGLHDLKYEVINYKSMTIASAPLTVINIKLMCNHSVTPWCDCSEPNTENNIQKTSKS